MARIKERRIEEWKAKQEVEDFIKSNPTAELFDISIELNLPPDQVENMLKIIKGGA